MKILIIELVTPLDCKLIAIVDDGNVPTFQN